MAKSVTISMASIKVWSNKADAYFKALPSMIKNSPTDEQIAYYCVFAGILLIIIGFLLLFVL